MNKTKLKVFIGGFLMAVSCAGFVENRAKANITLLDKDDWKFLVGGFVELDTIADSTRSLSEVVGSSKIDQPGSANGNGDNGRTQFSIRNSRFDFTILPPAVSGWNTKGYLEFDFLGFDPDVSTGGSSEASYQTNPTLRVRHAYLAAEKDGWQILAGQYWSLFGWQPIYVLSTASVPPVTATLYERTPQVTLLKTMHMGDQHQIQAGFSIARPVQRDSQIPNLDAGVRWTYGGRRAGFASYTGEIKPEPMSLAASGTLRQFVAQDAGGSVSSSTHFLGSAFALNGLIPVLASEDDKDASNSLSLVGEYTMGIGYGDQFPNWSGGIAKAFAGTQANGWPAPFTIDLDPGLGGYDSGGSFQLVHLQTWNVQVQYHFPKGWDSFTTWGYGQLSSWNVYNILGAKYDRTTVYFGNLFHDFTKQIRVALEGDHFVSHYIDGSNGNDNRIQVSGYFRF